MKLYALPGTCALAPNIALQWAGADYEVELIDRHTLKQPDYLAVHPLGKVPALIRDDGRILTEATAILNWIGEVYPEAELAGADAEERLAINQWLSFMATEVHASAFGPHFAPHRFHPEDGEHDKVRATAHGRLPALYRQLEDRLNRRPYPVGGRRTIADPYLYLLTRWTDLTPMPLKDYPGLQAFRETMETDRRVNRALELQGMKQ